MGQASPESKRYQLVSHTFGMASANPVSRLVLSDGVSRAGRPFQGVYAQSQVKGVATKDRVSMTATFAWGDNGICTFLD